MAKKQYQENSEGRSMEDRALDLFAEMMIKEIEKIQDNWQKPWITEGVMPIPKNLDGREYNGMNSLMLMLHCQEKGYKIPVFMTFDRVAGLNFKEGRKTGGSQAIDKNGQPLPHVTVNKGEKSFPVFITTFTVVNPETWEKIKYDDYKRLSEEERAKYNVFPKLHVYNVFNVDQTNIAEARPELYQKLVDQNTQKKPEIQPGEEFALPFFDKMIQDNLWLCPIKPTPGDDAYYSISRDVIVVPEKKQFKDGEAFYSTTLHEMGHSTGAESRLNRLVPTAFGSKSYGEEELKAELIAAFVAQRYGMVKHLKSDSGAYIKSWLDSLKQDPNFIKSVLLDVKKGSAMVIEGLEKVRLSLELAQPEVSDNVQTQLEETPPAVTILEKTSKVDRFAVVQTDNPSYYMSQNNGDYAAMYTNNLEDAIHFETKESAEASLVLAQSKTPDLPLKVEPVQVYLLPQEQREALIKDNLPQYLKEKYGEINVPEPRKLTVILKNIPSRPEEMTIGLKEQILETTAALERDHEKALSSLVTAEATGNGTQRDAVAFLQLQRARDNMRNATLKLDIASPETLAVRDRTLMETKVQVEKTTDAAVLPYLQKYMWDKDAIYNKTAEPGRGASKEQRSEWKALSPEQQAHAQTQAALLKAAANWGADPLLVQREEEARSRRSVREQIVSEGFAVKALSTGAYISAIEQDSIKLESHPANAMLFETPEEASKAVLDPLANNPNVSALDLQIVDLSENMQTQTPSVPEGIGIISYNSESDSWTVDVTHPERIASTIDVEAFADTLEAWEQNPAEGRYVFGNAIDAIKFNTLNESSIYNNVSASSKDSLSVMEVATAPRQDHEQNVKEILNEFTQLGEAAPKFGKTLPEIFSEAQVKIMAIRFAYNDPQLSVSNLHSAMAHGYENSLEKMAQQHEQLAPESVEPHIFIKKGNEYVENDSYSLTDPEVRTTSSQDDALSFKTLAAAQAAILHLEMLTPATNSEADRFSIEDASLQPPLKDLGTYDIPEWAISYLEYGESDSLTEEETNMIDKFVKENFPEGFVMNVNWDDTNEFNRYPAFGPRNENALTTHGESPYLATTTHPVQFVSPTQRETYGVELPKAGQLGRIEQNLTGQYEVSVKPGMITVNLEQRATELGGKVSPRDESRFIFPLAANAEAFNNTPSLQQAQKESQTQGQENSEEQSRSFRR